MSEFENSFRKFQPVLPDDLDDLKLLLPVKKKFICSLAHVSEIVEHISDIYRILVIGVNRTISTPIAFPNKAGIKISDSMDFDTGKSEIDNGLFRVFESGMQLFGQYKRIMLTNNHEWVTIDFDLNYTTLSGKSISFESNAIVGIYMKEEPAFSLITELLEKYIVPDNTYNYNLLDKLLLYSVLKMNMPGTEIHIIDNSFR